MRLSRARQSVTMARYRASKTWSGSSVWGKKVRSGSGKIGTKILATAKSASADGRQLERREGPQPLGHAIGQRAESSGLARVGLANHDGDARIAAFSRVDFERDAREQRNAELFGNLVAATFPEDGVLGAGVRGDEGAHVLDDAQDGHVELAEH